jgi:MFS family permease
VSLWRETEFGKLLTAAVVAAGGFHVSVMAMQLTAALVLDASAIEMGILVAAEFVPGLVIALPAGVGVDRMRRRPVMIAADAGRAVLLAVVPIAWVGGWLSMSLLYLVALGVGLLTTLFDVAAPAYLPSLVGRARLLQANGALQAGSAAVTVIGPNVAGVLVQALTAPLTLGVAGIGYVASAVSLMTIRHPEPAATKAHSPPMRAAIGEALRYLLDHPVLRTLSVTSAAYSFFQAMRAAVFVLFMTRVLELEPVTLGFVWGAGGAGALLGALVAARLAARVGTGRALIAAYLLGPFAALAPAAVLVPEAVVPIVLVGQLGMGFWGPVYGVNASTLTQSLVDERVIGRVVAANRFMYRAPEPLGALVGGVVGSIVGAGSTLLLAAVGISLGAFLVYRSPVRDVR